MSTFKDPGQLSIDDRNTSDGIADYYRRKDEEKQRASSELVRARLTGDRKAIKKAQAAYERACYVGD